MVRWYYRSVFDELEDLREYLESLDRQITRITTGSLLLPADDAVLLLPAERAITPVEVREADDEVLVSAIIAGGAMKEDISLDLISPMTLEIQYRRVSECTDEDAGYRLAEQISGSVQQIVSLPVPVTKAGSSASYREGILKIHLKKVRKASEGKIFIR